MKFNKKRVRGAIHREEVDERVKRSETIEARRIETRLRKALEVYGGITQAAKWSITYAARLLCTLSVDPEDEVREWYRQNRSARSYDVSRRCSYFYAYLKDGRMATEDKMVYDAYRMLSKKHFGEVSLDQRAFAGRGVEIIARLKEWLGKGTGNEIEDTLVDYLDAVFAGVKQFKPELAANPKSLLGDYGWSLFTGWVKEEFGGVAGYRVPTKQEQRQIKKRHELLDQITKLRGAALAQGNVALYDALGKCSDSTTLKQVLKKYE